jgi:hypothetical protein
LIVKIERVDNWIIYQTPYGAIDEQKTDPEILQQMKNFLLKFGNYQGAMISGDVYKVYLNDGSYYYSPAFVRVWNPRLKQYFNTEVRQPDKIYPFGYYIEGIGGYSRSSGYEKYVKTDARTPTTKQNAAIHKEIEVQKINLYRKDYDGGRKQYYWTLTHMNQPFRLSDVQQYKNNSRFLVEAGDITPFVAIGARKYITAPIITTPPEPTPPEPMPTEPMPTEPQTKKNGSLFAPDTEKTISTGAIIAVIGGVLVASTIIKRGKI